MNAGKNSIFATTADPQEEESSTKRIIFHMGNAETILFSFWRPATTTGILLSCGAVLIMCFVVELIRLLRTYNDTQRIPVNEKRLRYAPRCSAYIMVDALLHLIQLVFTYLLMMTFMTFNIWLCLAVVMGEVSFRALFNTLFPRYEASNSACQAY